MNKTRTERVYDKVALIYDGLMKVIDYKEWANYILQIANRYINKDARLLEIAAGNCKVANIIYAEYPNLIAADLSLQMLRSDIENQVDKSCCNMIALPFKIKFDFIYCTFDSINYLLTKIALLLFFQQINEILADDGIFTFDVSLENNSLGFIKEQITEGNYREFKYRKVSRYNRINKIHTNIFYINFNGMNLKEIHKQKIFDFNTYFDYMDKAGLYVKECYDAFSFNPGSSGSRRVQFVVRRKAA